MTPTRARAIAAVGARRIERRRAENIELRERIALRLARADELERENAKLREQLEAKRKS